MAKLKWAKYRRHCRQVHWPSTPLFPPLLPLPLSTCLFCFALLFSTFRLAINRYTRKTLRVLVLTLQRASCRTATGLHTAAGPASRLSCVDLWGARDCILCMGFCFWARVDCKVVGMNTTFCFVFIIRDFCREPGAHHVLWGEWRVLAEGCFPWAQKLESCWESCTSNSQACLGEVSRHVWAH